MVDTLVRVALAWAQEGQVQTVLLDLPDGATIADALAAAEVRDGITFGADQDVGIWGRLQPRTARLADGDRVELLRPLLADPKENRRRRARGGD